MSYGLIIRDNEYYEMIVGHGKRNEYPCVAFMDEADDFQYVKTSEDCEVPLLEASEIKIVACHNEDDISSLYDVTYSWSDTAFQDTIGFGDTPHFVVSGEKLCRWYEKRTRAQEAFPWAPVIDIGDFVGQETFREMNLEEVLCLG